MCGAVGGSSAAASLMAALAVGAGSLGGSREIALSHGSVACMRTDMRAWRAYLAKPIEDTSLLWPALRHPAGFDPHGTSTGTPVRQTLARLAELDAASRSAWLSANLAAMEQASGPSTFAIWSGRSRALRSGFRAGGRRDAVLAPAPAGRGGPRTGGATTRATSAFLGTEIQLEDVGEEHR